MIVVSYYTSDYQQYAELLEPDLRRFHIKYNLVEIEDKGGWGQNTNFKPVFLKRQLLTYREPVLWIDADARVRKPLSFFDSLDCDLACHVYRNREVLTGTLYLAYNSKVFSLLEDWIIKIHEQPEIWEQKNLQRALKDSSGLKLINLPPEYCKIFDLMQGEAVIEHFQKSRIHNPNHPMKK